ncbi:hypothetical protein EVAR_55063_1 [Eumeta japonica]|uniref:Uncharacterized protein n=1 Tax=Eumeta variegata TaxID=151549 RepID=A0A4C1Z3X3_EUMVA|nr:hypothetical protein EVAR_55063_1 [Eumeta japonica]
MSVPVLLRVSLSIANPQSGTSIEIKSSTFSRRVRDARPGLGGLLELDKETFVRRIDRGRYVAQTRRKHFTLGCRSHVAAIQNDESLFTNVSSLGLVARAGAAPHGAARDRRLNNLTSARAPRPGGRRARGQPAPR